MLRQPQAFPSVHHKHVERPAMNIEQVRRELRNMEEELYATKLGGKAGDVAWFQVLCEHVNALPDGEAAERRDVHAEQITRVLWYTPEVLNRLNGKRRRT